MAFPTLPTLEELLHPERQPGAIRKEAQESKDPLAPIQLFNVGWRNKSGEIPHVVLPKELTGVRCEIVVMSAMHYPTGSHKVGPAYSCLREAILDRDLNTDGATLVFPSTGNYGIGGSWVGPRVGFRSLVVLPEEMSAERFEKIRGYGADVIATPGCESNVKEIYDKVWELRQDKSNVILNQFEEFGNYRYHYHVTGGAARELALELEARGTGKGRVSGFVSAMGSAGTSAAADYLKAQFPECRAVAVEPVQCPTLFNVGYGGHAIEGIGDKHVTWIHNVKNCDLLVCIERRAHVARNATSPRGPRDPQKRARPRRRLPRVHRQHVRPLGCLQCARVHQGGQALGARRGRSALHGRDRWLRSLPVGDRAVETRQKAP